MPEGTLSQKFQVSTGPLPASRKVFVAGERHPDVRVAMREIDLSPAAGASRRCVPTIRPAPIPIRR